jgi:hypothetical protein
MRARPGTVVARRRHALCSLGNVTLYIDFNAFDIEMVKL